MTEQGVIAQTPIQRFYADSNVFITGGTGFLGRILIEKLLRSCSDINAIYILVRHKKGKNLETRVDELLDDKLFERLKSEHPKFRHKVFGIGGDCSLPGLGICDNDRQTLIEKINIVFHVAATVRFDEKLKMAVAINIRSPQDILQLSKQMQNLRSFIHVSTAYANAPESIIEERCYPAPIDSAKLLQLTDTLPEKMLDDITPILLDKYPNTYTFTKQIAEDVVRIEGRGLPVAIFRPAIVVATYKEPVRGWINNLYGPTGVAAAAGVGLLRALRTNPNVNANIVPVDMCVNGMIACAWQIAQENNNNQNQINQITNEEQPPVYNYESSNDQPINWGEFMHSAQSYGVQTPSTKAIWYYCLFLFKSRSMYWLATIFMHFLPAIMVDFVLLCMGKSPKMVKVYKKVHKFTNVISYFSTRNWQFRSNSMRKLIGQMTEEDQKLFFCDLKKLDWQEFFSKYLLGVRLYLLDDPIETLAVAKVKWQRLYWAHNALKAVLVLVIIRLVWFVVSTILG